MPLKYNQKSRSGSLPMASANGHSQAINPLMALPQTQPRAGSWGSGVQTSGSGWEGIAGRGLVQMSRGQLRKEAPVPHNHDKGYSQAGQVPAILRTTCGHLQPPPPPWQGGRVTGACLWGLQWSTSAPKSVHCEIHLKRLGNPALPTGSHISCLFAL